MTSTPTSMMSKATITCMGLDCPERKSVCCGAISTQYINHRGYVVPAKFACSKCGKPFQGGECNAYDTPPAKRVLCHACHKPIKIEELGGVKSINGKEAWFHNNVACLIREAHSKSFFDYSLREKKEIIDTAGKDAQKMMQETIRKGTPTTKEKECSNCMVRKGGSIRVLNVAHPHCMDCDRCIDGRCYAFPPIPTPPAKKKV